MKPDSAFPSRRRLLFLAAASSLSLFGFMRGSRLLNAQDKAPDKAGFPDGFDAVQVAPQSHTVLFENAIVRVLQVVVAPGTREPMHHHRWPSMFINWVTGGRSGHIRIYHVDGSIHDVPSHETPVSPGSWRIQWMKPEPMHSIENLETAESAATLPKNPPTIRVEFKVAG
jgi:hypothetical protein